MVSSESSNPSPEIIFAGGGSMGALMRSHDWSQSCLGAVETWPQSLKIGVRMILGSRYPMFIWWGTQFINLYNDAYSPMLGQRHPLALGKPATEIWADVWDVVGMQAESTLQKGDSSWNQELLLLTERNGYLEEAYFTFSYSPITEDSGETSGVFCVVTEETERVLSDRRLWTLRELGAQTAQTKTVDQACQIATAVLAHNPKDIPFALIYRVDNDQQQAQLISTTNLAMNTTASPSVIKLGDQTSDCWLLNSVLATGENRVIDDLIERFGQLPGTAWDTSPNCAIILPLIRPGQKTFGVLIAGVSPYRPLDEDYQGFFALVAGLVTTAIANTLAYEEERKRAEALAELDRVKTTFFNNISHEFRTPLTLMLGPAEDALADPDHPLSPPQQQRIEVIHRNGLRLLKLVNTLLDFSRIESARICAVYELTDLATLTAELASVFRAAIERANLRLVVDCPILPEPVYVDRQMWEKIVLNLLSNAFKFTFFGEITVRLQPVGEHVQLTVEDTGIGIPAAEIPHLFERFHRVKGALSRSFEGTGIGLSLVQELVALHQGTIQVTSVEGQGSCFSVTIPTGSAHLPQSPIQVTQPHLYPTTAAISYLEEALGWLPEETKDRETVSGSTDPGDGGNSTFFTPPSTARILLVDDNPDMRDYLKRLLSEKWQVETAANGAIALSLIQKQPPDLILSDVMMPKMDGFQLLQALRSDPQTQSIPLILLSARAGAEATIEGLEAGADDYLIKPFSARELIARVNTQLQMVRLRQESSANRFKTEFLMTLTHELQAPIIIILGWVRLLKNQFFNSETIARALATIERNAIIEAKLVENLLDISKFLSGNLRLNTQEIDLVVLGKIIQNQVKHFQELATEKNIKLSEEAPQFLSGKIVGDCDRLQQIINHLLDNAIKFTPKQGQINVRLELIENYAQITVIDTGIGMNSEFIPYIFDRFTQAEVPSRHSPGGVGIGLALAQILVELHHGMIEVASEGEGQGATFTVRLPLINAAQIELNPQQAS